MLRPKGVTVHYEVELGLIIGKTIRDLHPEDTEGAMSAIQGLSNIHNLTIHVAPVMVGNFVVDWIKLTF